jgi:hypothetical protein
MPTPSSVHWALAASILTCPPAPPPSTQKHFSYGNRSSTNSSGASQLVQEETRIAQWQRAHLQLHDNLWNKDTLETSHKQVSPFQRCHHFMVQYALITAIWCPYFAGYPYFTGCPFFTGFTLPNISTVLFLTHIFYPLTFLWVRTPKTRRLPDSNHCSRRRYLSNKTSLSISAYIGFVCVCVFFYFTMKVSQRRSG